MGKKDLIGYQLAGKKIGVLGFGTIGSEIVNIFVNLGNSVHACGLNYSEKRRVELADCGVTLVKDNLDLCLGKEQSAQRFVQS